MFTGQELTFNDVREIIDDRYQVGDKFFVVVPAPKTCGGYEEELAVEVMCDAALKFVNEVEASESCIKVRLVLGRGSAYLHLAEDD